MSNLLRVLFVFSVSIFVFSACNLDSGTQEFSYTKATGIYADLDDIRAIPLLGTVQEIVDPGKIFVEEEFLLIGEEKKGIHVLDNSDPSNPTQVGFINIPGNREFYIEGNFLYAETYYDMIKVDISNPEQPTLVNRVENTFAPRLFNDTQNALIGFTFEEINEEVDIDSDLFFELQQGQYDEIYFDYQENIIPESAVPASFAGNGNTSGSVNRITRAKDHVYAITNNKINIFSDINQLEFVKEEYGNWGLETIYPYNNHLFIGARGSMEIYNIANPSNPQFISSFWHATSCDPVYPVDETAYLTLRSGDDCPGDNNSLTVLDISNINNPQEVMNFEMDSPYGMSLINDVLYVGEGQNGIKLFDVTQKMRPQLIKSERSIEAYDIIPHPTNSEIILVAGPKGFGQYEIDQDYNMTLISWIDIQI